MLANPRPGFFAFPVSTFCWILLVLLSAPAIPDLSIAQTSVATKSIDFARQVKPILSNKCYACHGPDENQRATDLRLDDSESARDPDRGVIVTGAPEDSELIHRIQSTDPDMVMPPPDQVKQLTESEKQILRQWIAEGAAWEKHWAFRPVRSPTLPDTRATWPPGAEALPNWSPVQDHPIDAFVLARLQEQGRQPSGPADPQVLLRRLSFDLTGLPPSLEQQDHFAQQIRTVGFQTAYREQVDRLLGSVAFGERMAVYWLDLVRYADTVGYHGDQPVSISPYRDWVIHAFNSNLPFDQFTREQLAGDLLPDPTDQQKIASGYNRLGMMSAEGGVQPEEYLLKYAADRVRTTGTTWLGLTLGCAECHDHKYDPLSTREFYQFSAFFADIKEKGLYAGSDNSGKWGPSMDVVDPELPALVQPLESELAELRRRMGTDEEADRQADLWEASLRQSSQSDWRPLNLENTRSLGGATLTVSDDGAVLVSGKNPEIDTYLMTFEIEQPAQSLRLDVLPDSRLPNQGPGRAGNGNLVVTELIVFDGDQTGASPETFQTPDAGASQAGGRIPLSSARATVEQDGSPHPDGKWSAASAIDQDRHGPEVGWALLPQVGRVQQLVVSLSKPLSPGTYTIAMLQNHGSHHTVGRFRWSAHPQADAPFSPELQFPLEVQQAWGTVPDQRSAAQQATLREYWRSIAPEYESIRREIRMKQEQIEQLRRQHTRSTLITVSVPAREVRVLPRGNWMDKSGDVVAPGVPRVLGDTELGEQPTRLDLANWLVRPENPLTARVFVNRLWRMYFGRGLSSMLDDLGTQGDPPTHPQLLDFLASHFSSQWDVKDTIRLIVTSNTYQQSSAYRQDLAAWDPENRWLARQARFRLDAEFIRDHALSVSGLLNSETGGRSVFPYQPAGLYRHLNFPTRTYTASTGPDQFRRGVYTHWQRQFLHPAMKTLDAPSREECTAARPRSSTPLAALLLLNDPSYVEAARALAERAVRTESETARRIDLMYRLGFSRPATEREKAILSELLAQHQQHYRQEPEMARQFLSVGITGTPQELASSDDETVAALAAWTSVARAIMNLHEFVSRR